ncbi:MULTISPECIES: isochorismate synthase MenF [Enterobacteriaceae]|uniref:Isochorismate synthase MenF n=1 Tax=Kluyvera genomosp. 2 TaxID=2774054 RepID=A0A2T2Y888_9ENTR|nr:MULTISPECIES: isochorismate synthase MenF [Enterobacteriaceae]HAT3916532.1 isochorismate synthase MenF [Kluyvera ascorbata]PSR48750.1 isochorismate synthase MenF [Kluyvera genomosp. 2]BBQ83040.1 menaquinone-specific isochorismate synthase [Klebsiella sp. WP3-W18-ESBL-02]BBR20074.1 menaquinone-specific isochorismate synthase [Klebsiella sp. WP3-S18-ESBL-05]BBR59699.1 menaquinone-specific isochorismate synthase [Klebsiella sp. WP4-W18-ESBL-05]
MLSILAALQSLSARLADDFPALPGTRILEVAFPLNDAFDPLAWLNGQAVWPQFYWQQRSGKEEIAALGAVRVFSSLTQANDFLAMQARDDVRVCGINAFTPTEGSLFLPRLEWRREAGRAVLRLNVCSDVSLAQDAALARACLALLTDHHASAALTLRQESETHRPGKEGWCRLISQATEAIRHGEFTKVVLARATDLTFTHAPDAGALMAASRRVNFSCYHFFMAFDARRAFLGSSPERLFRRRGVDLLTEALAGTVAAHDDPTVAQRLGDWLMRDDKNQRENGLVVDDICQRLQDVTQALDVLPAEIVRLRKVQHLRRRIQATLTRPDDALCLLQLQPTAAVAGLPRAAALAFIERFEPFTREAYAGSAGYLSRQQSEFCVTLRSAKVEDRTVRLYAGAGIVDGSDPEQEWQEIENKAAGLRSLLFSE